MTGFSEIRFFPLAVCILISSFLYMVICIVVYRIKREKLMVEKRVENLPHREQQQNIKKDVKKKGLQLILITHGNGLTKKSLKIKILQHYLEVDLTQE